MWIGVQTKYWLSILNHLDREKEREKEGERDREKERKRVGVRRGRVTSNNVSD